MIKRVYISLTLLFLWSTAHAVEMQGIPQFVDEMVEKYQFNRDELDKVFQHAAYRPDVIAAISAPATKRPWLQYRAAFINPLRINKGVEFWRHYEKTLRRAELRYGVPKEIIVAVIGVETLYGKQSGGFRTLDALTTLAFDYPRRAEFFRNELAQYLLLAREQKFNLFDVRASYAGALGIPQFMPSSYRKYAVDFNANGRVDLLHEPEDAIGSVANYLKVYGWRSGERVALRAKLDQTAEAPLDQKMRDAAAWQALGVMPEKQNEKLLTHSSLIDFTVESDKEYWLAFENFRVIMLYNNSNYYAMSVFQLAQALKSARSGFNKLGAHRHIG
jgi:membrane-bound lytic murein transglycosylase B